jgi:long-chain acyl-CoA synthetase
MNWRRFSKVRHRNLTKSGLLSIFQRSDLFRRLGYWSLEHFLERFLKYSVGIGRDFSPYIESMFLPDKDNIYTAPVHEEGVEACRQTDCGIKEAAVHLGRSLPSLLDEGCQLSPDSTINYYGQGRWQSETLRSLKQATEEVALALRQYRQIDRQIDWQIDWQIEKGDRAALLMASDSAFVTADIGCLLAQLVTVPISPEQSREAIIYMLKETAARVLFISDEKQLKQLLPKLSELSELRLIVVAAERENKAADSVDSSLNSRPTHTLQTLQNQLPDTVEIITLGALRQQATWTETQAQALRADIDAQALATIVYTLSESGQLLGAMLSHENLSGSALAAFSALPCLRKGASEVALSFLPLHHIFARGFVYGSLCYGQNLYFSNPRQVMKHLGELKPTVFFTVPRLLEKVYEGWLAAPQKLKGPFAYLPKMLWAWGQRLAKHYQLSTRPSWLEKVQLWVARRSVFRPIGQLFGGRLHCFISGGAALPAEVMALFLAAGLGLCQGYGLTEASSTVSFTRRQWSRAGTVGVPMPGVEMALAPDGEVMVRAPYVMQGYYQHPEATQAVLEPNGWLHTGDRGEFSADGLLTLTGYKKELFKLSIGEYIAPKVAEQALRASPLVQHALVVGPGRKFCAMLIFPEMIALAAQARQLGLLMPVEQCLEEPQILAIFQALINQANLSLPVGCTIKRFRLVNAELTVANHLLQSSRQLTSGQLVSHQLNRDALYLTFANDIDKLYEALPKKSSQESTQSIIQTITPTTLSQPGTSQPAL